MPRRKELVEMRSIPRFASCAAYALSLSVLMQIGVMAQAAPAQGQQQPAGGAQARPQQPPQPLAWAPKPTSLTPYTGVHKPHTKLADVLAAHRGQ
jgi:hypothetical protein